MGGFSWSAQRRVDFLAVSTVLVECLVTNDSRNAQRLTRTLMNVGR